MCLKVEDFHKYYGKVKAIDGLNFNVNKGEIYALVGPNGAGKSTVLKTIATLLKPSKGKITLFDYDVVKDAEKIREIISYLPEEAGIYKDLTGEYYLEFMASLFANNIREKDEYLERAKEICELGDRLSNKVKTYSKGMIRKILLARALMKKPKFAILDEPTSGLDVVNAVKIRNIIKNFSKEGVTVLLSSHNMLEVEFLADRVGVIYKGKIYEEGRVSELKKKYNSENLEDVFARIVNE